MVHLFGENVISILTSVSVLQKEIKAVFWAEKALIIYNVKRPTKKIFVCGGGGEGDKAAGRDLGNMYAYRVNSHFSGQIEIL